MNTITITAAMMATYPWLANEGFAVGQQYLVMDLVNYLASYTKWLLNAGCENKGAPGRPTKPPVV